MKKIKKKECLFKTNTDTETILHAYEEYGKLFVNSLNAIFIHTCLLYRFVI